MSQEFKINGMHCNDVTQSLHDVKTEDLIKKPFGEFMRHVRSSLGMTGFNTLDPSRENELLAKIEKLEAENKEKDKKYASDLKDITEQITELKNNQAENQGD